MKRKPRYITVEEHMEDDVNLNIKLKKVLNKGIITIIFVVLAFSIIFSFISYTLVLSKENDLLKLHKQTSLTQMENVEVKSKVEFARSLYNVESKAASLVYLHKPDKVIEISANNADIMVNVEYDKEIEVERIVGGY